MERSPFQLSLSAPLKRSSTAPSVLRKTYGAGITCWSGPVLKLGALGQAKWKGQVTYLFCHTILCYGFWMSWVWTDQRWILENFSGTKVGCVASKAIGKHDLKSAFEKKLAFTAVKHFHRGHTCQIEIAKIAEQRRSRVLCAVAAVAAHLTLNLSQREKDTLTI